MDNVMIDIETLSTEENATIVSIGAVLFDTFETGAEFYEVCNLEQERALDVDTIKWWLQQSDAARSVFKQDSIPLSHALNMFVMFIAKNNATHVWANSPDFDLDILSDACGQLCIAWPVAFWQRRDVRTAKGLIPSGMIGTPDVAHNALSDCHHQIKIVQAASIVALKYEELLINEQHQEPPPWQDEHIIKEYTSYDEAGTTLGKHTSRESARAALTEYAITLEAAIGDGSEGVWNGEGDPPEIVDGRGKHDWVREGDVFVFDITYRCSKCHALHTESIDDPKSGLPEYGCVVVPISDNDHIDKFQHSGRGQVLKAAIDKVEYAGTPDHKEPPADVKEKIAKSEGFVEEAGTISDDAFKELDERVEPVLDGDNSDEVLEGD